MALLKSILLFLLTGLSINSLMSQEHVKWTYQVKPMGKDEVILTFVADIAEGWNSYSQFLKTNDGPVPTSFKFAPGSHYQLSGKAEESGDIVTTFDEIFGVELTKLKHKVTFSQRVRVIDAQKPITGELEFMVCNGEMCLPPKTVAFTFSPLEAMKNN